jgi:hypothetical protein
MKLCLSNTLKTLKTKFQLFQPEEEHLRIQLEVTSLTFFFLSDTQVDTSETLAILNGQRVK